MTGAKFIKHILIHAAKFLYQDFKSCTMSVTMKECAQCIPVGGAAFATREAVYGGAAQSWAGAVYDNDVMLS